MKRWGKWLAVWLAVLLVVSGISLPARAETPSADQRLDATLKHYVAELRENPETRGMLVGYEVVSLDRSRTLSALREHNTFVPGSTVKLLLAAAAVDRWSADTKIPTEVWLDGTLSSGGVFRGNVWLKGYGDPSLDEKQLRKLAKALADQGIRKVEGNIGVDDRYFDRVRLGTSWVWDDEPYPISAQIGALSVDQNTVRVQVTPGRHTGQAPRVTVTPAPDYVQVINRAQTVEGDQQQLTITRTRAKNEIVITGTIGEDHTGVTVRRTVEEPDVFTGWVFKEQLNRVGIRFSSSTRVISGELPSSAKCISQTLSPTVDRLLQRTIKTGDNFYAEMLLKRLGATEKGVGSAEAGIEAIQTFAARVGVDIDFRQVDGSGLSRQDVVAPHHLIQLLTAMDKHPARERFWSFLPVAGVDGTLKDRMTGTPAEKNVRAKTGGEFGLTGITTSRSGERLAFAVLIRGTKEKALSKAFQDRIAVAATTYPDLPDPGELPPEDAYLLTERLNPLLDAEPYRGVVSGVMVESLDRGDVLYERNGPALLTPASNAKLFTSAAALGLLGPDDRLHTRLFRTGPIQNGVLHGDLILQGGGDPTLATEGALRVQEGPTIHQMVNDIQAAGIKRVTGSVIVDTTAFTDDVYGRGWSWADENEYYQPQITALSINRGTVRLDYLPGGQVGDPIRLSLTPQTRYVRVINTAVTGPAGSENTLSISRDRGTNTIRVSGSLPLDFQGDYTRVPVENPHLYTGELLREQLENAGVAFNQPSSAQAGTVPQEAELIRDYPSPPMSEIVRYMNKNSDNFYAEMLLRVLGLQKEGAGTAQAGVEAVNDYLRQLKLNFQADLVDGSGLSREDQLSAEELVQLLSTVSRSPVAAPFTDSLPVAGVDGTLQSRMRNTAAANNLRAKTGSLTDVSALSGYVRTKDGERLVFSMIMNGYTAGSLRQLQDRIGVMLAEFQREE
jgi:D-alanyl-D-alanine carboxypeptidase/D-alanyl-D-alanine-endopeptidase (penicillin-binding protein 4)